MTKAKKLEIKDMPIVKVKTKGRRSISLEKPVEKPYKKIPIFSPPFWSEEHRKLQDENTKLKYRVNKFRDALTDLLTEDDRES